MTKLIKDAIIAIGYVKGTKGFYYDFTRIVNDGELLNEVVTEMGERLAKLECDTLIGSGYGGAQLCTALTARFPQYKSVIVRSDPHPGQNQRQVEGDIEGAKRMVFIDDAVYSGKSIRKLIDVIGPESTSKIISGIVIFDDWQPLGTRQIEQQYFPIIGLVRRHDIGITRDAQPLGEATALKKTYLYPRALRWADYEGNTAHWWMKSSPLIHGDVLYNTTDRFEVKAYDLKTGDVKWQHKLHGSYRMSRGLPTHVPTGADKGVVQTLGIAADNHLYVGSYDGSVTKFDLDGNVKWVVKLDAAVHATPQYHPTEKCLFVNTESWQHRSSIGGGYLRRLNADTGTTEWTYKWNDFPPSTVLLTDDAVIATANDGQIASFNVDGELNWSNYTKAEVKSPVLALDGALFAMDSKGTLTKLDERTGEILWEVNGATTGWMVSPFLYCGLIIVWDSLAGNNHMAYGYDPETGARKWMSRLRHVPASLHKIGQDELMIISANGHLAYYKGLNKEWETNYKLPGATLASQAALDVSRKLLAMNLRSGGLHVYNLE